MRAHPRGWQQWVVPQKGSLVTLLCRLTGTKDTSTFKPPLAAQRLRQLDPIFIRGGVAPPHRRCYETFSAAEAFALSQRFEFHYTPKSASWLNMIEIEFSALSKQCLDRRIATKEELTKEVLAIVKERAEKAIKITWQFSIEKARIKLNRHYEGVQAKNIRYKIT